MLRLLTVLTLIAIVSSTSDKNDVPKKNKDLAEEFTDPKAVLVKEKIDSLQKNMNKILMGFTKTYRPSTNTNEALQIYKFSAEIVEGTDCHVDKKKFDATFRGLVLDCASSAATETAIDLGLEIETNTMLKELKESDHMLRDIGKSTDDSEQKKTTLYKKLDKVMTKAVKLGQQVITNTSAMMRECIGLHEEILYGELIRAAMSIRDCNDMF